LHVVDADGSNLRLLASAERAAPSWAPDESSIIFSTSIEIGAASGDLYLVTNIDGPGDPVVTQLTSTMDVGERVPKVSPDGLTVAYASGPVAAEGPAPSSVILADYPTLTNPQVLTSEADCMDVPQGWTPDGQYIYFTRAELVTGPSESLVASSWRLWRVKADGSELAELVPGLEDWDGGIWSGVTFLKQGVHGSAAYTLPGYTNVPLSIAAVGVENLAGLQTDLRFKDCCNIFDTMDTCAKGAMIDHWAMVTPSFDQVAGTVDVIAYAANPELDKVSGTGYLLNLTASMAMYEDLWWDQGTSPVFFAGVKLSDDWGEPIDMPVITGGLTLKPFSYLELSAVPAQVMADEVDPEPFSLTITARGDADELLPWVAKQVELFVEMPTDPDYPIWDWWIYNDIITPTSVALVDGTWTGDVSILGPVNPPARILARYEDWGGRSNDFTTLAKGDINADGVIDIFDVVK
ncbi:MAG: hypothetical protein GTN78_26065, partial [Gemmatimonadales bacterium]|nr:hypothetical protein [Gemmatimonadales bacterium]